MGVFANPMWTSWADKHKSHVLTLATAAGCSVGSVPTSKYLTFSCFCCVEHYENILAFILLYDNIFFL